jgi:hypothetical protein
VRSVRRTWLSWWCASLLLAGLAVWGLLSAPAVTVGLLAVAAVGLFALLRRLRLPAHRVVRVGYWFVDPGRVASLHFLPPIELRTARRALTLGQALRGLREFLGRLDEFGITLLYVETDLVAVERLGFQRVGPASPLTWAFISLQSWVATGRWHWRWPSLYVYRPAEGRGLR